jgi:hypothetical protein
MTTGRVPLNNSIQSRTASTAKDARLVNAVKEDSRIVKRPGLLAPTLTPALPVGTGQGLFSWNAYIVAVANNQVTLVNSIGGTVTPSGVTITGALTPISFTQTANDAYLVFHNGSNIYTLDKATNTVVSPLSGTGVISATVNNGGGYYTTAPSVLFNLPSAARQATGTATLFNNSVSSIIITDAGDSTGYLGTSPIPTITIAAPPNGVNATVTLHLVGGTGPQYYVGLVSGGSGYITAPIVTVTYQYSAGLFTTIQMTTQLIAGSVSSVAYQPFVPARGTIPTSPTITPAPAAITATATANMSNTIKGPYAAGIVYLNGSFYVLQKDIVTQTSSSVVTMNLSAPNPVVVTQVGHGLVAGTAVKFSTTGALPTGLIVGTTYYVVAPVTPDSYSVSTVIQGTPVQTSGTQSGVHTASYTYTTNSRIYGSNMEDPKTWNALNYITAGSDPDSSVAIARHLNYLIAFGQWSTEFFYDAGGAYPGSPLANYTSAKCEIGCVNGYSVVQLEQTVIWVGQSLTEGRAVYLMDGTSPHKISDRHIDKYLNADQMQDIRAYTFKYAGHTLYVLTLLFSNTTLVYDLDEKTWYQWTSQSAGVEGYFKWTAFSGNVEYQLGATTMAFQDYVTGGIAYMSDNYYDDAGQAIYFRAITPLLDSGTVKRKFYTSVEVVGDKVVGNLQIRHTSDDYQNWSGYRTVRLQDTRPIIYQCGTARRRAWEVFSSESIPIRLEALELAFDIGEQGMGAE